MKHKWLTSAVNESTAQSNMLIERLKAFADMSKLQGMLMNVIAKNMSTEGIGALQDVFDALVSKLFLLSSRQCTKHIL